MAIAEDLAVIHESRAEDPFTVEQHGIDYIPVSERWASPRTSSACGPEPASRSNTSFTAPS